MVSFIIRFDFIGKQWSQQTQTLRSMNDPTKIKPIPHEIIRFDCIKGVVYLFQNKPIPTENHPFRWFLGKSGFYHDVTTLNSCYVIVLLLHVKTL